MFLSSLPSAGDNLGWYSETPATCTGNTETIFQLQVNNSAFSGASISQIVLNASAFSSISSTPPTGWNTSVSNGVITWNNVTDASAISANSYLNFVWSGLAPSLAYSVQDVFPLTIYWDTGSFTVLQAAEGCFVNANIQFVEPKTIPSGVLFYVPITLANLQSLPVAGGSQIMLNIDWNTYSTYLDNPVNNLVFFDYSGNSLNAWLQSGTANTATSSTLWLKLNSTAIAALSSETIYMGFYATATNHLSSSGPFGEAPTLTGTYGQYDDGGNVFNFYNNFAGAMLSGSWTTVKSGSGITITVNNGLTVRTTSNSAYGFIVGPTETYPLVAETYTSSGDSILGESTSSLLNGFIAPYSGYSLNWYAGTDYMTYQAHNSNPYIATIAQSTFPAGVWQVTWSATSSQYFADGVGNTYAGSNTGVSIANYAMYLGQSNGVTASSVFQWARMRAVLPNNQMPSYLVRTCYCRIEQIP